MRHALFQTERLAFAHMSYPKKISQIIYLPNMELGCARWSRSCVLNCDARGPRFKRRQGQTFISRWLPGTHLHYLDLLGLVQANGRWNLHVFLHFGAYF